MTDKKKPKTPDFAIRNADGEQVGIDLKKVAEHLRDSDDPVESEWAASLDASHRATAERHASPEYQERIAKAREKRRQKLEDDAAISKARGKLHDASPNEVVEVPIGDIEELPEPGEDPPQLIDLQEMDTAQLPVKKKKSRMPGWMKKMLGRE